MNQAAKTTAAFVGGALVVLLIREAVTLTNRHDGDTISEVVNNTAVAQPVAGVAVGALAVHFAGGVPRFQRFLSRVPLAALALGGLVGAGWPLKGLR